MASLIGLFALVAVVLVSNRRQWTHSPLHMAFGTTLIAFILLTTGLLGYTIEKNNWSFVSVSASDGIVWWEVQVGLVFVVAAAFFWRRGIRLLP